MKGEIANDRERTGFDDLLGIVAPIM